MTHTFSTTEETRLNALRFAEQLYMSRSLNPTADGLVKDAKIIEAYLVSDPE